ncbi:hypothetical protein HZA97_05410 [Candidatus Woesearchaeota archaeon]|nr:hypothetical protein [Candidatus Woesearchaeota archaeon]
MVVIGLTSFNGGGKDVISEYLKQKGFVSFSLSDMLREECRKANVPVTRENLINKGNELRSKHGFGVLGKLAREKVKKGEKVVITSFRHPDEVLELKKNPDFVLVKVLANQKIRFERIKARNREDDPQTFEEFLKLEQKEFDSSEPHKQKIAQCVEMAELFVINEGNLEELHEKVEELLNSLNE